MSQRGTRRAPDVGDERPAPPIGALSPRATQVVEAARFLLETEGPDALTMRRLGETLGIRAPSIYKHFPGKHALEIALIENALVEMGAVLRRAVDPAAPRQRISALLTAYRDLGLAHPSLYRLATAGPLPRSEMTPGLEDWAGEPFFLAAEDPHLAQALWSFAHGMVILELDRRYPDNAELDRTWAAGAAAFATARRASRARPGGHRRATYPPVDG